ncbi:DUF501 domain-containing protein [Gephyromycinifex aptenodytis]|uniref:DUF501 domain-containing protein n=1 Tax=Gephyromycinifex aptenodytis TaxID=2716227 RepID=UPI001448000C|nr:DUF501 domain-containing protein [Gephyromycinifex aptenodytis]
MNEQVGPGPESLTNADLAAVHSQLGRAPRDIVQIAHRCPCGQPDVVATAPRLSDGTPFPTTFYATCPRLTGAISTLESSGLMREMSARLQQDAELAANYQRAHEDYLERRDALGEVPEIAGISAGGMPKRVKCLHVLVGHSLATGPGVNPLGDEALEALPRWWEAGPCGTQTGKAPETTRPSEQAQDPAGGPQISDGAHAVAERNE